MSELQERKESGKFEKGKTITLSVGNSHVKITFAAQANEHISEKIKSTLLNAYSAKIS